MDDDSDLERMTGMACPMCHAKARIKDSRSLRDNTIIRRRRRCPACEHRFTTYERAMSDAPKLVPDEDNAKAAARLSQELRTVAWHLDLWAARKDL